MDKKPKNRFQELKLISTSFGENSETLKLTLLKTCSFTKKPSLTQILDYHNALLFLLAYPETQGLKKAASHALEKLYTLVKKLPKTQRIRLERTGLPYTNTQGHYSFALVKWLINKYPNRVKLTAIEPDGIHPKYVLGHVCMEMEFDLVADEFLSPQKWLEKACGTKNKHLQLTFVIKQLDATGNTAAIKDQAFESLKMVVCLESDSNQLSRGGLKLASSSTHFHSSGLLKKFSEHGIIQKPLPKLKKLGTNEKLKLIEVSRCTLFLLSRETDPVTLSDKKGIEYYELDHGLSIALYSMEAERRLPLESYIGFIMFKNGYPMAYGGAWLFGSKSLLGINIFESYRGGESAFVFSQLLRTYKQRFNVSYFEVEPYQFGKNNYEGLKSGAFWFYYRFGFRPVDVTLKMIAEVEFEKIQSDKNRRTPISVLKGFTESNLALNFDGHAPPADASTLSQYVTQQINLRFGSDRKVAMAWVMDELRTHLKLDVRRANTLERIGIYKLAPFVVFCINLGKLSKKQKTILKALILEKGKSEFVYAELCNKIGFNTLIREKEILSELGY